MTTNCVNLVKLIATILIEEVATVVAKSGTNTRLVVVFLRVIFSICDVKASSNKRQMKLSRCCWELRTEWKDV